ncbi:MAG: thioredoxin reductase [Gaiellales bacterium]|nr:thioredoxin reductase [Gaiellales bacterium]
MKIREPYYAATEFAANPSITVCGSTEVARLDGDHELESISLVAGELREQECHGLFCFIGAEPATSWLTDVALDEHGFIRTDVQITDDELGENMVSARARTSALRDEPAWHLRRRRRPPRLDENGWPRRSAKAPALSDRCTPQSAPEHDAGRAAFGVVNRILTCRWSHRRSRDRSALCQRK